MKHASADDCRLIELGNAFRRLATEWDQLVGQDENDERIPALGDKVEKRAERIAGLPAATLPGLRAKAAAFAHYAGANYAAEPGSVADALLCSLLNDLLRGTPDARWRAGSFSD